MHPTLYWYDILLLGAAVFWPFSITALLALAWLGWRKRRHWAGMPLLLASGGAIVIVAQAALHTR
jgi:hypothetical protein